MTSRLPAPQFDVFLSEHEQSEIFIGGYISHKIVESLDWASVANVDLGYWQVKIVTVRIDGEVLDICKDVIWRMCGYGNFVARHSSTV